VQQTHNLVHWGMLCWLSLKAKTVDSVL